MNNQSETKTLNGKFVMPSMYAAAVAARQMNKRVWFAELTSVMDDTTIDGVCRNCHGAKRLVLEIAASAPSDDPYPSVGEDKLGIINDGQRWYKVARQSYPCPVCSNMREVLL